MYKVQNKEERGITLVALIITVIILVILAAVTITAVTNMSIISTAKRGAEDYLRGGQEENDLFNITAGILNEVIKGNGSSGIGEINEPEDTGLTLTQLASDYIGAYVNYDNYVDAQAAKTIYTSGTYNGNDASLSWTRQNLIWRILDVDTSSNIVRLIAQAPDTQKLTLKGADGYNNAVKILNDICRNCYSSSTLGVTARSINIEDFERNGIGNVGQGYATMATTTSILNRIGVPTISLSEKNQYPQGTSSGTHTLGRSDQTNWVTGISSFGSSYQLAYTNYYKALSNFSNTSDKPYYAIFSNQTGNTGASNDTYYWIASRCVDYNSNNAHFGVFHLYTSGLSAYGLYLSGGYTNSIAFAVRPVVEIPLTSITITADVAHDGSTGAKALQIRK